MSGQIANRWTGDSIPAGETITAANANAAGNGSEVSYGGSGTATMVKEGRGFRVVAQADGIRRFDASIAGAEAVRLQCRMKIDALPTGSASAFIQVRSSSGAIRTMTIGSNGRIGVGGLANTTTSPAVTPGDTVLVDVVAPRSSSPTAGNGRVFFRVKNLTNSAWNGTGEYFYDSGYTLDAGTAAFSLVRFGKPTIEPLPEPGVLYEFIGWEVITVNSADTSESQAKAYFADTPAETLAPTSGAARPLAGPGSGSSGWTTYGGAGGEGEALSDSSTATGIESPDLTSTATERIFRLQPMVPRTQLQIGVQCQTVNASGAPTFQVKVYSGSTVVATKALAATGTLSTINVLLTSSETAAITNWNDVRVGIRAVA